MRLYHGTTLANAQRIIAEGLQPRRQTDGNWQEAPSRPDCVYLTTVYAPYFALTASGPAEGLQPAAIIEVETDLLPQKRLLPDEDAMEQATRNLDGEYHGASIKERSAYYRDHLTEFQEYWQESIRLLGTCAFKGVIEPKAITRIVEWDWQKNPYLTASALDPTITILNYRFMQPKYRAVTRFIMGDDYDYDDLMVGMSREIAGFTDNPKFEKGIVFRPNERGKLIYTKEMV